MKEFKAEVERMENERQELANAEKLFDLPITMYPELLEVQKDMKGMDQIYMLYDEQKVNHIIIYNAINSKKKKVRRYL